eukprot:8613231-Alexandrium_andersonii.AAC.1
MSCMLMHSQTCMTLLFRTEPRTEHAVSQKRCVCSMRPEGGACCLLQASRAGISTFRNAVAANANRAIRRRSVCASCVL